MRLRCLPFFTVLLSWLAASPRALALLTFNDGTDKVFVNATYSFGYDSNIFTQQVAHGSATQNYSFGMNYARKAGLIGVSTALNWSFGDFGSYAAQDFVDPAYSVIFTKGTGRTTGSLAFTAQKTNTPDPDANNRAVAWNYGVSLDMRYPVNDRYYFTNATDYSNVLYTNRALFTDLGSIDDGVALNYVFDSQLDFNGGYKFALSQTDNTTNYDHSLTLGAAGSLLSKLTGSVSAGYEERHSDFDGTDANYGSLTSDVSLGWKYSKLLGFTSDINKSFSTSSTDVSLDTTSASLNTDINLVRRLRTSVLFSYTGTDFLGDLGDGRRDRLWQMVLNLGTAITTHVRANLAYAYMINYSNADGASFTRDTVTLTLSADY